MIFKYKKITDAITTYTPLGNYKELGVVDGFTYIEGTAESSDKVVLIQVDSYEKDKINELIVEKIRQKYSLNDELKILNAGTDAEKEDFLAYREECIAWGDAEKAKL